MATLIGAPASAQVALDSWTGWDGAQQQWSAPLPSPNSSGFNSYVQIFTAPAAQLTGWTAYLFSPEGEAQAQLRGMVFRWDPTRGPAGAALSDALYTGDVFTSPTGSQPAPVTVFSGALALTAGAQYALVLTSSGITQAPGAMARLAYRREDALADAWGARMNATSPEALNAANAAWSAVGDEDRWQHYPAYDLALELQFGPGGQQVVPEPVTVLLLGTGLSGLFLARRTRRRTLT